MRDQVTIDAARDVIVRSGIATISFLTYYTDEYHVYYLQCLDAAAQPMQLTASEHAAAATLTESMYRAALGDDERLLLPDLQIEGRDYMYEDVGRGGVTPNRTTITFVGEDNWLAIDDPYVYEHDDWGGGFDGKYRADDPYDFAYTLSDD